MSFALQIDGETTTQSNFIFTTTDVVATNGTFDNLTATNGTITNLSFSTFSPSNINTGTINATGNLTVDGDTVIHGDTKIDGLVNSNSLSTNAIDATTLQLFVSLNTPLINSTGEINLTYNSGISKFINETNGNLGIQSMNDNIILEPNKNDANTGKVEIDGDLEVQHEFFLGTSSQAKIYQDINKLYIEADTSSPSGKDIYLRPQSGVDTEAVKILSGYGYGLLETDKVRVDDLEFTYLNNIVDLETTLQDLTTNSITFSNGNGTAIISQDNIGRLSLTSSTDDIYIQPKSFGRVQINGDLKIAGGYDEIQLNTAKINDFSSLFLLSSQNKEIRLRPKQGFSAEDVVISAGLGFSQLQADKLIASTILQAGGVANVETELISHQSQINGKQNVLTNTSNVVVQNLSAVDDLTGKYVFMTGAQNSIAFSATRKDYVDGLIATKQNTLIAGTNISIVGNTISSTANVSLSATAPVNISNNVISVLLDTSPTLASTNLINSGNIKNSIDLKQDVITTSSNLHFDNCDLDGHLTVVGDAYADEVFVNGTQNTNANALTRKDYVDTQVATKQNTLTTGEGIVINNNIIEADNQSIIVDNFADVYQNLTTIQTYMTRLGYTNNFNTSGSGILNNGYTYPQVSNNSVDGFLQKTLPNYAGNVEVRFGNNGTGLCKVLLDGVQKATASSGQTSLINFTFTANQVLKITQETNAILIPYHIKIKNHISLEASYPVKISGTTVSLFEDVVPTQGSLNFLNSGDIFTALATKQNTITSSTSLVGFDITALNQLVGADVFVTNSQSTVPNSLTRKDYVDTQVATKQNTLTTSTNLNVNNIDCNDLTTDNLKIYDIGNTVLALIAHRNMASSSDYTLAISQNGDTTLNVNSSGNLKFTKNGTTNIATMNSTGIIIDSGKDLFIGSTSLTSLLSGKQETLNNTIDVNCANLFSADEVTGAEMFVSNSQPNVANSLTRKDYVDTQVATKQNTLIAGTNISIVGNTISSTGGGGSTLTATDGVKIDGTVISADNRTIVIDDLANVYSTFAIVRDYLIGLGYTLTNMNNIIPPYIQRGAFFYPRLYGSGSLNGRIEKTLPNFNGQLTINYGNGNVNNGFVRIYLDNVLQDTATQTEQDKTLVVDFTPNQALKLEETNSGAIIIYQIITRQRLALPVARTRLSQMSYYSRDAGSNIGTGIINLYSNTYNYILNDLGIVFTNQVDGNSSTGWLLPIGTYKIHYKYSFDNLTFNNRLGVRCRASMNGTDYQQSVGYSYGRDDNFIDKQSVQADFLYVATTATYMRLTLNCAKNNTTYASNWDNTKILAGSSVIIEKID